MPYKPIKGENMSFTTKKYTRPVLLSSLNSINARNYSSLSSFVSSFSPRAGTKSAKLSALKSVVGSRTFNTLFKSSSTGTINKQTLINLVKSSN